jgi:hypothetical protein
VLANPLARAILEELLTGRKPRRELSSLGPPPRVSDALKDLELLGALQRDQQLVLLVEPAIHLVDEILAREHRREYLRARSRLRHARFAARSQRHLSLSVGGPAPGSFGLYRWRRGPRNAP